MATAIAQTTPWQFSISSLKSGRVVYSSLGFSHIVVCIDGSESSLKAADVAIEMARQLGSHVTALYVIVSQLGYAYSAGMLGTSKESAIDNLLQQSKQEAGEWFGKLEARARSAGVALKTEVIASQAAVVQAVISYSEKNSADIIVTGTRGRTGLTKMFLGSVASGIVAYSTCPVLVVK